MLELIDEAIKLGGKRIVEIDAEKYTIVGDLHADYKALKKILKEREGLTVFLGDYGDRGDDPLNVYRAVLEGYVEGDFILLRGNHESRDVFPHDLPEKLDGEIYAKLNEFWETLPVCAIINNEVFAVHGGIYTKSCRISEENVSLRDLKTEDAKIELMWNDPWEDDRCVPNFRRGVGYIFGKSATERFLDNLDLKIVVRSHEPYKVLKAEQDGLLVTVGSTTVYGTDFAIIKVSGRFSDGFDLIRKFGYVFESGSF